MPATAGRDLRRPRLAGADRADRAAHAMRLVRCRPGSVTYTYLTHVLGPTVLPRREVARLDARRRDIELALGMVKRHLGVHLRWSAREVVSLQHVGRC